MSDEPEKSRKYPYTPDVTPDERRRYIALQEAMEIVPSETAKVLDAARKIEDFLKGVRKLEQVK
jgi:hypothetical protein